MLIIFLRCLFICLELLFIVPGIRLKTHFIFIKIVGNEIKIPYIKKFVDENISENNFGN